MKNLWARRRNYYLFLLLDNLYYKILFILTVLSFQVGCSSFPVILIRWLVLRIGTWQFIILRNRIFMKRTPILTPLHILLNPLLLLFCFNTTSWRLGYAACSLKSICLNCCMLEGLNVIGIEKCKWCCSWICVLRWKRGILQKTKKRRIWSRGGGTFD